MGQCYPTQGANRCALDGHPRVSRLAGWSEALEVVADFRIGPVGVADNFAANQALAVDDVGFRPAVGTVELCHLLVGVADGVQVDVVAIEEASVRTGIFVDADSEDGDIRPVVVKLHESRGLLDAGWALTPPEVQEHDFATVIREADGVFAVTNGEIGSDAICIDRVRAAVATREKGECNQRSKGDEARKPHILIIRTGRYSGKGHESHGIRQADRR